MMSHNFYQKSVNKYAFNILWVPNSVFEITVCFMFWLLHIFTLSFIFTFTIQHIVVALQTTKIVCMWATIKVKNKYDILAFDSSFSANLRVCSYVFYYRCANVNTKINRCTHLSVWQSLSWLNAHFKMIFSVMRLTYSNTSKGLFVFAWPSHVSCGPKNEQLWCK